MGSINDSEKHIKYYVCIKCAFKCSKKGDYTRHLSTKKHFQCHNDSKDTPNNKEWICKCGKKYKYDSGYYRHKKTCNFIENNKSKESSFSNDKIIIDDEMDYKEMFIKMMTENLELRKTITDLIPKIGSNNNNNINQKININMFLNEECKNAMTIEHFVNNITVSMANVFLTKNKGIDEGISNIFIENMNKLSPYERPMHCTDTKRDTVYIKSDNGSEAHWSKDTDYEKFKEAIKIVERKQHKNIQLWMAEHPGWETNQSLQEEYLDLMRSCTSDVKEQKIIKKVCNTVKID
jgi:hypothetical protein